MKIEKIKKKTLLTSLVSPLIFQPTIPIFAQQSKYKKSDNSNVSKTIIFLSRC